MEDGKLLSYLRAMYMYAITKNLISTTNEKEKKLSILIQQFMLGYKVLVLIYCMYCL